MSSARPHHGINIITILPCCLLTYAPCAQVLLPGVRAALAAAPGATGTADSGAGGELPPPALPAASATAALICSAVAATAMTVCARLPGWAVPLPCNVADAVTLAKVGWVPKTTWHPSIIVCHLMMQAASPVPCDLAQLTLHVACVCM